MSIYNGLSGNEGLLAPLAISGATHPTTPIEITTTTNHGLVEGEYVDVYGVQGNKAANGRHYVKVTAANKVTLYHSFTAGVPTTPVTSSGAYTTGGTLQSNSFAAGENLPEDLIVAADAASLNGPLEGNFDREAYLLRRVGKYRAYEIGYAGNDPTVDPTIAWFTGSAPAGAWGDPEELFPAFQSFPIARDLIVGPGDIVEAEFTAAASAAATSPLAFALRASLYNFDLTVASTVQGSNVNLPANSTYLSLPLQMWFKNNTSQSFLLFMHTIARSFGGVEVYHFYGSFSLKIKVWAGN